MYIWIITYIPTGYKTERTTEVPGDNKLQDQKYFSNYYSGTILEIAKK